KRDEPLLRDKAAHDFANLLVDQRLAARDRDHRRSALFGSIPTLLRRHAAIEDGIGIVDLAATGARQIAAKQRLQHQHEWITFAAKQLLLEHVRADTQLLVERNSHYACLPECNEPTLPVNPTGSRNSLSVSRLSPPPERRGSI